MTNTDAPAIPVNPVVTSMKPSATLAMTARAKELKSEGRPVIGLSAGEPDFDTPRPIRDAAIAAIEEGFTHYTVNAGILPLREEICRALEKNRGLSYEPDQILCSNGAKQSVAQAIFALAGTGDEVIVPAPCWVSYPEMARMSGATPVVVETSVEDEYKISPEKLESAITEKTRVLILCSPSNPTGAVYTRADLEGLSEVLQRHEHVFIISDEIYEHIVYDAPLVSFGTLPGMKDRVITVNGFSKGFAMTGWRLGYMAADRTIVKAASKLQSQFTSAPCSISQKAGVAALRMDANEITTMVNAFRERRDFLYRWAKGDPKMSCPKPEGAFYLFPDIAAYLNTVTPSGRQIASSTDLCMFLLEEHNVALVPGDAFGAPTGIRISYAAALEDIREAARRIRAGLDSLQPC